MFRAIDTHQAASARGIVVACIDRDKLRYARKDHALIIQREVIVGPDEEPAQAVYLTRGLKWLPPYQDEPIDDAERAGIAKDIVAACRTFGIDTEVVGS